MVVKGSYDLASNRTEPCLREPPKQSQTHPGFSQAMGTPPVKLGGPDSEWLRAQLETACIPCLTRQQYMHLVCRLSTVHI